MKHTPLVLLAFILLSTPLAATAQQSGDFTYTSDGSAITITGYTGPGGAVTIPDTITGLYVTGIGDGAFQNQNSLTSVSIPGSVTNIGLRVFSACATLNAIAVDPANPAYSSLDGVLFNKSQTTLIQCPGGKAGSYPIPDSVTSIGYDAFDLCTKLTSVTIPGGVTNIGAYAFANCDSLTNVTISDGVTSVGGFDYCTSLTSIIIPGSVTNIDSLAFYYCTSLTNVTIPGSVTSIGGGAFWDCFSLSHVIIPDGVTSIEGNLFNECTSLTSITIPGSVTNIGYQVFYGCSSLTSVTILGRVTDIGNLAFLGCGGLEAVFFKGNAPVVGFSVLFGANIATVYYLPNTTGWSATFAGRPTKLWNPLMQSAGIGPAGFAFNITGTADIPIVIEAATSPANTSWVPLQSLNLTNGAFYFTDSNWTNYPARFYRIRSP